MVATVLVLCGVPLSPLTRGERVGVGRTGSPHGSARSRSLRRVLRPPGPTRGRHSVHQGLLNDSDRESMQPMDARLPVSDPASYQRLQHFRSFRKLCGSQAIRLIREAACAGPALGRGAYSAAA
jgi:hypothetical protein